MIPHQGNEYKIGGKNMLDYFSYVLQRRVYFQHYTVPLCLGIDRVACFGMCRV